MPLMNVESGSLTETGVQPLLSVRFAETSPILLFKTYSHRSYN